MKLTGIGSGGECVKAARACKALYLLMFERFTMHHDLNNLICVWTTDESEKSLDL